MGNIDAILGQKHFKKLSDSIWSAIPLWIPTGAINLDFAIAGNIRRGGIPLTRFVEISGPSSSGKSTLLDSIMLEALKLGCYVFIGDPEDSHDEDRMEAIGITEDMNIRFMEPKEKWVKQDGIETLCLEDFFILADETTTEIRAVDKETPILFCLDSLAFTDMRSVLRDKDTSYGETYKMNLEQKRAKYLSQHLKTLNPKLLRNKASMIFINQLRTNPGVTFGDPRYEGGGTAKNYAAGFKLWLNGGSEIKTIADPTRTHLHDDPVGLSCPFKVMKSKVGPPFRKGNFPIYFDDRAIFRPECLADFLIDAKVGLRGDCEFEQQNRTFIWGGEKIATSRKELIMFFDQNGVIAEEVEEHVTKVIEESAK